MPKYLPRRALVTGASSGMGQALARRLVDRGVEVWLAARRVDRLEALQQELSEAGATTHVLPLDVANNEETFEAMQKLDVDSGGIDLVVANAGIGGDAGALPLGGSGWADIAPLFTVNLLGAIATLAPFIPKMIERQRGQLCGISSIAADVPLPFGAPYGASKAGLSFFLESADLELRPQGIPVTIVHPGFVQTEMTEGANFPQPFLVDVERAAQHIDDALLTGLPFVRFPLPLSAAAWAVDKLPTRIRNKIIRSAVPKTVSKTPRAKD